MDIFHITKNDGHIVYDIIHHTICVLKGQKIFKKLKQGNTLSITHNAVRFDSQLENIERLRKDSF